ncbi:hypothetical protein E2C01_084792 [Portunus trituberculatus]|uniref:Uncharacterized protein n=1 Tax=Portunus trituberculatus TaxID=210409 RepID=A0A5B7J0X7_PORTR|nr:hypothetical protein [Portunus trituberculatus]
MTPLTCLPALSQPLILLSCSVHLSYPVHLFKYLVYLFYITSRILIIFSLLHFHKNSGLLLGASSLSTSERTMTTLSPSLCSVRFRVKGIEHTTKDESQVSCDISESEGWESEFKWVEFESKGVESESCGVECDVKGIESSFKGIVRFIVPLEEERRLIHQATPLGGHFTALLQWPSSACIPSEETYQARVGRHSVRSSCLWKNTMYPSSSDLMGHVGGEMVVEEEEEGGEVVGALEGERDLFLFGMVGLEN